MVIIAYNILNTSYLDFEHEDNKVSSKRRKQPMSA